MKNKQEYIPLPFVRECLPEETEEELRAAEEVVIDFYSSILRISQSQHIRKIKKFEDRGALTKSDHPTNLEDTRNNH